MSVNSYDGKHGKLACLELNEDHTQTDIAKAANVTGVTIRTIYKTLKAFIKK